MQCIVVYSELTYHLKATALDEIHHLGQYCYINDFFVELHGPNIPFLCTYGPMNYSIIN